MSGTDLAAVVVTIASVAATTVLLVASVALVRALRAARRTVDRVAADAPAALAALQRAAAEAEGELARVDTLLDRADRVSATLEDASKLTYLAVTNPVIKAAALASGVRQGAKRLRGGAAEEPVPAPTTGPGTTAGPGATAAARNGRRRDRREER